MKNQKQSIKEARELLKSYKDVMRFLPEGISLLESFDPDAALGFLSVCRPPEPYDLSEQAAWLDTFKNYPTQIFFLGFTIGENWQCLPFLSKNIKTRIFILRSLWPKLLISGCMNFEGGVKNAFPTIEKLEKIQPVLSLASEFLTEEAWEK